MNQLIDYLAECILEDKKAEAKKRREERRKKTPRRRKKRPATKPVSTPTV